MFLSYSGLKINKPNFKYMTPLMIAAQNGCEKIVHLIIQIGKADLNAQDNKYYTALHYAVASNKIPVIQTIICAPGVERRAYTANGQNIFTLTTNKQVLEFLAKYQ